jgi:hypothetical protein
MPHAEVIRRTLLRLTHASDEDVAGYILDAYEIRVHPKHVAAVRKSPRGRLYGRHGVLLQLARREVHRRKPA